MATTKRSVGLNASPISCYHLMSRVVDKAYHLQDPKFKSWMVDLLKRLSSAYAVKVYGYAMMSNHFHILVQWAPHQTEQWNDQEVMKRWEIAHPIRNNHRDLARDPEYIERVRQNRLADPEWIASARTKLANLSYFMRDFKSAVSIHLNKSTGRLGTLWEGRYKLDALKDQYELKNAMSYVDLNPFAAGLGDRPETSPHGSLHERASALQQAQKQAQQQTTQANPAALIPSQGGSRNSALEQTSSSDCAYSSEQASLSNSANPSSPAYPAPPPLTNTWLHGYKDTLSLKSYLEFVDRVARLVRKGKKQLDQSIETILDRLEAHLKKHLDQATDQAQQDLQSQLNSLRPCWTRWIKWESV